MRPIRSSPTAVRATSPRARTLVSGRFRPAVPAEHLDHDPVPVDREHLAAPDRSVRCDHVDELVVADPVRGCAKSSGPAT